MCDRHSRQIGFGTVGAIDIMTAITLCDAYGLYREDFEYVLMLEEVITPRLRQQASAKEEKDKNKNKPTIH